MLLLLLIASIWRVQTDPRMTTGPNRITAELG